MMALRNYKKCSIFLLCIVVPMAGQAKIADFDEYLQKRSVESYEESLKSFNPNPEGVTDDFNTLVGKSLIGTRLSSKMHNGTRRNILNNEEGWCKATNPIDRCWRCDRNWNKNRKKLAECGAGFGYRARGGKEGRYYLVEDASDEDMVNPKAGTLRHAVTQREPLWIIFAHSMVIRLKQELIVSSDKTIDGRGVQVHIAYGAGITLQFVQNVIIHNIWIHNIVPASGGTIRDAVDHVGLRTQSDGDAITVFSSSNIWLDHISLSRATDGLIDVIEGSTAITISNCKFNHHNDVMLLGANDLSSKDAIMQVTVAFNRFGIGLIQRMPRARWGFVHVVNNDYSHWELYAIGGSAHPTIISQGNRFRASNYRYTKEVTKRDYAQEAEWMKWQWRSEGDLFTNGAYFRESGPPFKHTNNPLTGDNLIKYRPGSFVGRLTRTAGALRCRYAQYC